MAGEKIQQCDEHAGKDCEVACDSQSQQELRARYKDSELVCDFQILQNFHDRYQYLGHEVYAECGFPGRNIAKFVSSSRSAV